MELVQKELARSKVELIAVKVTETDINSALAAAYKSTEENRALKKELTKVRVDGELLVVEVGMRMKH